MKNNINIGKIGENAACAYLIKNKYKILLRNYRDKFDEIDIIARSFDQTLVFCEVKTFASESNDPKSGLIPEDNLTSGKINKIRRSSQMFVAKHKNLVIDKAGWRIDCAVIVLNKNTGGNGIEYRYYENI